MAGAENHRRRQAPRDLNRVMPNAGWHIHMRQAKPRRRITHPPDQRPTWDPVQQIRCWLSDAPVRRSATAVVLPPYLTTPDPDLHNVAQEAIRPPPPAGYSGLVPLPLPHTSRDLPSSTTGPRAPGGAGRSARRSCDNGALILLLWWTQLAWNGVAYGESALCHVCSLFLLLPGVELQFRGPSPNLGFAHVS